METDFEKLIERIIEVKNTEIIEIKNELLKRDEKIQKLVADLAEVYEALTISKNKEKELFKISIKYRNAYVNLTTKRAMAETLSLEEHLHCHLKINE